MLDHEKALLTLKTAEDSIESMTGEISDL